MEAGGVNESFIDFENVDERKLVNLQAIWRGTVVRRWLCSVRESFEDICAEVDKNHVENVQWPRESLCRPYFLKDRDLKKLKTSSQSKRVTKTDVESNPVAKTYIESSCSPAGRSRTTRTVSCGEGTDSFSEAVLLRNQGSTYRQTENQSCQTVTMIADCIESSTDNPATASCRVDEQLPYKETNERQEYPLHTRLPSNEEPVHDDQSASDDIEHVEEQTYCNHTDTSQYPTDPQELSKLRKNLTMEMLWVQQAINSRKNYLTLKAGME